jgi:DNA adenine methylase
VRRKPTGSKKIAFGWYGGKYSHLDWLLPLLPEAQHYCEPFGGSAAVLLNREPSPVETYNDLDGEVVNFFRVLRDEKEGLLEAIGLTPFSREEFELACAPLSDSVSELERARRFFVRARQVRTGLAQTASLGRWANCLLTSRAGMAGAVSRWLGSVEGLAEIAQRLLRVQIENAPALEVIQRYDSEDTLFYCDPPYPHSSRGDSKAYAYEMTDAEQEQLAKALRNVEGKVALSSYHCRLMDELYRGWRCLEAPAKLCHSVKTQRVEVLWVNYDPETKNRARKQPRRPSARRTSSMPLFTEPPLAPRNELRMMKRLWAKSLPILRKAPLAHVSRSAIKGSKIPGIDH